MKYAIEITCQRGHRKRIAVEDESRERVDHLARLIDGTSALFEKSPRADTRTTVAKCKRCGEIFDARVIEIGPR